MKRLVLMVLLGASGCFSVDVVESPLLGGRSGGHAVVCNYGWTLFGCVPLVCGNDNMDSWCPLTFFKDEIRPEYAHAKLVSLAESRGCDIEDLNLMGDNYVLFDAWYAPVPWVLVYKETNLSANLMRRREEGRGKREEGMGKREEGMGKREEGMGKREEGMGNGEEEVEK